MNHAFNEYYLHYWKGSDFNYSLFENAAFEFLDANYSSHGKIDSFFNSYTSVWLDLISEKNRKYRHAKNIWISALTLTDKWENSRNKRIHKGTPYYFLAYNHLLESDLDSAFLLMHKAMDEDKITHEDPLSEAVPLPDTPARYFVTLDYTKLDQFAHDEVADAAEFFEEFIQEYYKTRKPPEDWILKIATGHKISKSMTGKKRKLKKGIKKNENTVS